MLYELPSKNELTRQILKRIIGKTLIFGNSLNSLIDICEATISSKNTPAQNNDILRKFQEGSINTICSFKMLEQGANLSKLNNIILHSYYGREKSFIQRLGRGRLDTNKPINLIVILTKNTQEEIWYRNMMENIELNIITCKDINEFTNQYIQNQ